MSEPSLQEIYDHNGHLDYDKVVEIVHINLKNFLIAILNESFTLAADDNYRIQIVDIDRKTRDQAFDIFLERKHVVSSEFYVELESRFYTSNSVVMHSLISDQGKLQTIDTDVIELALAIDNLVDRSVARHEKLIKQLSLQLEELSFLSHQEFNVNCLHPQDFYKLFQNCIAPLDTPADGKILIIKLLYQNISPNLNDFYLAMHQFLLDIDIHAIEQNSQNADTQDVALEDSDDTLSSSILSMSTGQFYAPVEQETWNQEFNAQHDPVGEQLDRTPKILETEIIDEVAMDVYGPGQTGLDETTVSLLLQPYSPGTQSNSSPAQRRQFVRALSRVQKVETASNAIFQANQIKTAVQRTLHEKGALDAVEIVNNEEKVIDFVSNIFQVILDDDSLCDAIKALLARLQISTIKLALIDFTFFQNSKHPARLLLNKLTSIGVSVTGKEGLLFKKLESIVKNITDNFDTNVEVFAQALDEIQKIDTESLQQQNSKNELDRNKHKLKSQRSAAKRVVIHTIKKFAKDKEIPNPMLEFCLKCWAPHMAYIYMNHGRSTREWRNAVRTLRRIFEVSQGIHSLHEVSQYIHSPEDFFENIRSDLEHLSNKSGEFEEILEEAEVWYLTYLRKIEQEVEEFEHQSVDEEIVYIEEQDNVQDNLIQLFKNLSSAPETATEKSEENRQVEEPNEASKSKNSHNEEGLEISLEKTTDEEKVSVSTSIDKVDSEVAAAPEEVEQEETEPEEDEPEVEPELTIAEHLPESIVPGVWLEIFQGDDKAKRRLKFSSADTETKQLFFTDRSGDYRFEIDLETFLDDLSTGRSNLISESNRFDLALSSVISNIRTSQDKAGTS